MSCNNESAKKAAVAKAIKTENQVSKNTVTGLDHLRHSRLNKGLAFTLEERQALCIHGLLPPSFKSLENQLEHCRLSFEYHKDELSKYMYLMNLLEQNERLFYRFFAENMSKVMPIVYTPTVGLACQKFGLVYSRPKGLFITIHDKGHVYEVLQNWPESDVRAIVVTDGERILGLGDLGANGMGIPVGKLALYTALAGIKPHQLLPITLDVGTNTEHLREDPLLYVGLRHPRVKGQEYDDFVDEFMKAAVKRFGPTCLIQFEDFGNHNAFRFLEKYRDEYCTFNDDIQGTASVALAGILASLKVTKTKLSDNVILFQGAGEASLGIAGLCVMAMQQEGLSEADAKKRIWLVDSKGLIVKNRPEGGVTGPKIQFAQDHKPIKNLEDVVAIVKPTILIGAAAVGGAFTPKILQLMADFNQKPIIFALSNPTIKAECTAEAAYHHTNGKAVFASGSPFDPVTYGGKTYHPGQGNNAYIFPGVALGVIAAGIKHITDEVFLLSAQALAEMVSDKDLSMGSLYPPLQSIRDCSLYIAQRVVNYAYKTGVATVFPEPADKESYIKSWQFKTDYSETPVPVSYSWPQEAVKP